MVHQLLSGELSALPGPPRLASLRSERQGARARFASTPRRWSPVQRPQRRPRPPISISSGRRGAPAPSPRPVSPPRRRTPFAVRRAGDPSGFARRFLTHCVSPRGATRYRAPSKSSGLTERPAPLSTLSPSHLEDARAGEADPEPSQPPHERVENAPIEPIPVPGNAPPSEAHPLTTAGPRSDTLRAMKQLADGVWHLNTMPVPNTVNAYLLGGRPDRRRHPPVAQGNPPPAPRPRGAAPTPSPTPTPTTRARATPSARRSASPSGSPSATPTPPRTPT